jgi:hypothetical protein
LRSDDLRSNDEGDEGDEGDLEEGDLRDEGKLRSNDLRCGNGNLEEGDDLRSGDDLRCDGESDESDLRSDVSVPLSFSIFIFYKIYIYKFLDLQRCKFRIVFENNP